METAKHFGSKLRKTLAALLATMALMAVLLPGALAVDLNVDVGFYFKQSRGGTCTLASAAMMRFAAGPIWTGWTAGWM